MKGGDKEPDDLLPIEEDPVVAATFLLANFTSDLLCMNLHQPKHR